MEYLDTEKPEGLNTNKLIIKKHNMEKTIE